ncbi:MAG: SRPBCC family protein [Casimicrobiaceae bacterium]
MKPGIDERQGWRAVGGAARTARTRLAEVRVTRRYGVAPSRVFAAWLDNDCAGRWLFATASWPMAHAQIDPRVEGSFWLVDRRGGEYAGEYIEIVPCRRLAFTLSMDELPRLVSRVTVDLVQLPKGCALTLTHADVPRGHARRVEGRWTGILYGLGVTLDSGPPHFTTDGSER